MLSVIIENSGKAAVLRCSGRIVAGEEAWTLYNSVVSLKNKRAVVLDLTRVSGTDARGLGVLMFVQQWARLSRVKLQLITSKPVQEMLELAGLLSLFDVRSSEDAEPAADFPVDSREQTMGISADD
jgi:anti-anti-sigma factor